MVEKPKLCIGLMHDYAARDFLDSGVLEQLAEAFSLSFVATDRLTLDIASFGPTHRYHEGTGLRLRVVQLARGLWHMGDKGKFELNRRHALARATFGIGGLNARLIRVLSAIGLGRPVVAVLRAYLRLTLRNSIPDAARPDALLVYTSVNSYFADDLVREARRKKIPLLALTNNWDNLNTKSFLEVPPYLGVWGEQGFLIARLMHLIPSHRIFVIGSPRFEIYRRLRPSRAEARAMLGLPEQGRALLFCGAGVSFEESSLIRELDAAIGDGTLPADMTVLYKPHPLRFQRTNEAPLDFAALPRIRLVQSQRSLSELSLYPYLMAAADGLISPFSTMVMEGAHAGLPALCLGYNDPGHSNHDWNRVAFNLHLYLVRHGEWAVICDRREKFLAGCQTLAGRLGDESTREQARAAAEMAWMMLGDGTVAGRIIAAVIRLLAGQDADESLAASLKGPEAPGSPGVEADK